MVSIDVLVIVAGVIYGYVRPGKEDRGVMIKKGAKIGILLGGALSLLNLLVGGGLLIASATVIWTLFAILYLTVMFIIGTFIGDFLEGKFKR